MYAHAVMSRSLAGRADNSGMIGWQELYFLYNMIKRCLIHLGHVLANFLICQGQLMRLSAIFAGHTSRGSYTRTERHGTTVIVHDVGYTELDGATETNRVNKGEHVVP